MKGIKILLSAVALSVLSLGAYAQENGNRDENGKVVRGAYETNSFGSNWFIGFGAGINSYFGKGTDPGIGFAPEVFVGKWITPSVGFRGMWHGITDKFDVSGDYLGDTKSWYNAARAQVLWNVSNAFSGYKETRIWDIILYPTFEVGFEKVRGAKGGLNTEYAAGFGWLNDFRLGKVVDLYLDLSCNVVPQSHFFNVNPVEKGDRFGFLPSATLGLIFNVGKVKNFNRHSSITPVVVPVPFTVDQYNELKDKVAALEKENAELKDEIEKLKNQAPDTVYVNAIGDLKSPATVYFEIGQTKLSERELAHLDFYAQNILATQPEKSFTVTGCADKGTGSAKRNQYLCEQRVKYVKDILTSKYGVSEDKLNIQTNNASERFESPALNRAVTIE